MAARKTTERRSPEQKAQEAHEEAKGRVVKAENAREVFEKAEVEYRRAVQLLEHAAHHPDLPQPEPETAEQDSAN
jgi:predicted transcriptional regulator